MAEEIGKTVGTWILFILFIGLILWVWWDMFTTPQTKVTALFPVIILLIWNWIYTSGEFLGKFFKRPTFITEGGATGKFLRKEDYEGGMSIYWVAVKRHIADYNNKQRKPKNIFEKFALSFTPSTVVQVEGKSSKFEFVPPNLSDNEAGAIIFRGTLNPDKNVPSPYAKLSAELDQRDNLISQLSTVFESASAVSGALSEEQSKNIVESAIKGSVILQNYNKAMQNKFMPQSQYKEY